MKKYYIGLVVLALLTVGSTVYILGLGMQSKEDKKVEKKAEEVAQKLNSYIQSNNEIPESLDELKLSDIPAAIQYTKKSDERYEFCVEYKAASRGYSTSSVSEVLYGAAAGSQFDVNTSDYGDSDYEPSYLYLGYGHKKGKNCQTIKPRIVQRSTRNNNSSILFDADSEYCDPEGEYYQYYKKYCPVED